MATKWLIFCVMLWVAGAIIGGAAEYQYFTQGNTDTLFAFFDTVEGISFSNPVTMVYDLVVTVWQLVKLLFGLLLWDFSFFTGSLQIVRIVFLIPISIGTFISFILALRGTSSG